MTIDEELIREALLDARPSSLEDVLATVEIYRTCVTTAARLLQNSSMQEERDQVVECAGYCRKTLEGYLARGRVADLRSRECGEARFTFTLDS